MPRFQPILLCKDYQEKDQANFRRLLEEVIESVADREVFLSPIIIAGQPLRGVDLDIGVHQASENLLTQIKSGQAFAEKKAPYDPAVFIDIGNCGNPGDIRTKALRAIPGVHRGFNVLVDNGNAKRPAPSLILRELRDVPSIDAQDFEGLVFFNHNEAREIIHTFTSGTGRKREIHTVVEAFKHHQNSCLTA